MLVLQAVLFVTLIWIVNRAVLASNQRRPAFSNVPDAVPEVVGSIPDCGNNRFVRHGQRCYSVLYTPAVSAISSPTKTLTAHMTVDIVALC